MCAMMAISVPTREYKSSKQNVSVCVCVWSAQYTTAAVYTLLSRRWSRVDTNSLGA